MSESVVVWYRGRSGPTAAAFTSSRAAASFIYAVAWNADQMLVEDVEGVEFPDGHFIHDWRDWEPVKRLAYREALMPPVVTPTVDVTHPSGQGSSRIVAAEVPGWLAHRIIKEVSDG